MKKSILCMTAVVLLTGGLWAQTQTTWLTSGNTSISHVNAHKHLSGIPSAQEVEEQGDVDLGAMNALLLEKVEELTRYVIDLQNQIDELKKGKE